MQRRRKGGSPASSASTLVLASLALLPIAVATLVSTTKTTGGDGIGIESGSHVHSQIAETRSEGAGGEYRGKMAGRDGGGGWRALVAGGTGATGRYLVAELLSSEKFSAVTVIGRREIDFPAEKRPTAEQLAKIRYQKIGDLSEIGALQLPEEYEVAFCALGTTRSAAGSAAAFRKVDHDGIIDFGALAKRTGVRHLQLVSSGMANKNSFFLYLKTKGEAEEAYRTLGVKQVSIFRPPVLERGESARTPEKLLLYVLPSVKVGLVAEAMVKKAEAVLQSETAEGVEILETKAIRQLVSQN